MCLSLKTAAKWWALPCLIRTGRFYAYPFLPKKLELEIENARKYKEEKQHCLFCDMLQAEKDFGERIIFSNEHFHGIPPLLLPNIPMVCISRATGITNIAAFNEEERTALAENAAPHHRACWTACSITSSLYMMCMYNEPVNGPDAADCFHFHIAFYPPMRSADKVKFNASSETGAWAHCNPYLPGGKAEDCAPLMLGSWPKKAVNNPAANRPPAFSGNPVYLYKNRPCESSRRAVFWFIVRNDGQGNEIFHHFAGEALRAQSRHGPFGFRTPPA